MTFRRRSTGNSPRFSKKRRGQAFLEGNDSGDFDFVVKIGNGFECRRTSLALIVTDDQQATWTTLRVTSHDAIIHAPFKHHVNSFGRTPTSLAVNVTLLRPV